MTNTKMLREYINASGYKLGYIAKRCGITYQAFCNRMNGSVEFRADEMRTLRGLLRLSTEESDAIFFASDVDETSTNVKNL